ncbi:MAG: VOC family protein [Acidimicrobiia bacterium]|nr:VOC family protein [Acidimicrobiia bacterium]
MERARGIGGAFMKSSTPEALKDWYVGMLGLPTDDDGYVVIPWRTVDGEVATTTLGFFDATTDYFPGPTMLNFRVANLDAMLEQLRAAGVAVSDDVMEHPYGRFGWCTDPDGNKVELWEPIEGQ